MTGFNVYMATQMAELNTYFHNLIAYFVNICNAIGVINATISKGAVRKGRRKL